MTTKSQTVQINYDLDSSTDCSGELFEIPESEVVGGDTLEIRIWARALSLLTPYTLYKGTVSMGAGTEVTTTEDEITEVIDFSETYKYQAEFPINSIVSIEAITEIVIIDPDTNDIINWATIGENVKAKFTLSGYSCIRELLNTPLYGSVRLVYKRPPYYKKWEWVIPTDAEGLHWFFLYKNGMVKNKFSVELPDLTASDTTLRNIALVISGRESGNPIPNASVTIDNVYQGVTDANGIILINDITQGTHTLLATASGYVDTDQDALLNDSFTVY